MTFKIINYVDVIKEINTEWTAICPNCQSKLKIKKDNGAYLCVSYCTPDQIKKALGIDKKFKDNYVPQKFIKPIPLENFKLSLIENYKSFSKKKITLLTLNIMLIFL